MEWEISLTIYFFVFKDSWPCLGLNLGFKLACFFGKRVVSDVIWLVMATLFLSIFESLENAVIASVNGVISVLQAC